MMTDSHTEEDIDRSGNGQLPGFPNVVLTFQGTKTFIDELPELGKEVKVEMTGYVRKTGVEYIEREESEREFAVVAVTGIKRL